MSDHGTEKKDSSVKKKGNSFWEIVNVARGALGPELEELARMATERIPEDSPLRTPKLRRIIGAIAQGVESHLDKLGPAGKVFGELGVDFVELISAELGDDEHETHEKEESKPKVPAWKAEFAKFATQRISDETKKTDPNMETLGKRLELEFEVLRTIMEKIEPPPAEKPHEEKKDLHPPKKQRTLREVNDEWRASLDKRKREEEEKSVSANLRELVLAFVETARKNINEKLKGMTHEVKATNQPKERS